MSSHDVNFEQLEYKVVDSVARIRLNRPDALNSFTTKLYGEIKNAVRLANSDETVDIIVITGAGRAFATGGDLQEVLDRLEDNNPLSMYAYDDNMPFDTIKYSAKITIASINGVCVAGGLALASACDLQVSIKSAVFGIPEARIGLASSMMPSLLLSNISLSKLKYLLFTAKSISAIEAERIGLITEVVEDDELDRRIENLINEVRRTSPTARSLYKEFINRMLPVAPNSDLQRGFRSTEFKEGLRAFGEKRNPKFQRKIEN